MRRVRAAVVMVSLLTLAACRGAPATPLSKAAAMGDLARIEALLKENVDPNDSDGRGVTALMWAARAGEVDSIRALMGAGARVDAQDHANGWTALQHAVHKNQKDAASALLEAGANPTPALIMAAGYGQTAVVRELLARGADPRAESHGVNALWAAAGGGAVADITDGPPLGTCYPDTARALLEVAPDLRLRSGWSIRVLRLLARSEECHELLTLSEARPASSSGSRTSQERRADP
jgi:ankyrin repeat protein